MYSDRGALAGVLTELGKLLRSAHPAASPLSSPTGAFAAVATAKTFAENSSSDSLASGADSADDRCGHAGCSCTPSKVLCTPPQLCSPRAARLTAGDDTPPATGAKNLSWQSSNISFSAPSTAAASAFNDGYIAADSDDAETTLTAVEVQPPSVAEPTDAEADAEVSAHLDALAASGYIVPDLDCTSSRPKGARLIQRGSVLTKIWVAPLEVVAPGAGGSGSSSSMASRSRNVARRCWSRSAISTAMSGPRRRGRRLPAAARRSATCPRSGTPCTRSARPSRSPRPARGQLRNAASPSTPSSPLFADVFVQPVHVEVQRCAENCTDTDSDDYASSCGTSSSASSSSSPNVPRPDYKVVAVHEYRPAGNGRAYLDRRVVFLAALMRHADEAIAMGAVRKLGDSLYAMNWDWLSLLNRTHAAVNNNKLENTVYDSSARCLKLIDAEAVLPCRLDQQLYGVTRCTPDYAAPEQLQEQGPWVAASSDVHACGQSIMAATFRVWELGGAGGAPGRGAGAVRHGERHTAGADGATAGAGVQLRGCGPGAAAHGGRGDGAAAGRIRSGPNAGGARLLTMDARMVYMLG